MSITGRLFRASVYGPIGLVGPTEASRRAKAQKKLLEEQNRQLARIAEVTERQSEPIKPSATVARTGRYYAVATKKIGDRVALVNDEKRLSAGAEGTVVEFTRFGGVGVVWDAGVRTLTVLSNLNLVAKASPDLPPPPEVSER